MKRSSILLISLSVIAASAGAGQLHQTLKLEAENFVRKQMKVEPDAQTFVTARSIDSRIALKSCQKPLEYRLAGQGKIKRTTPVHILCPDADGWQIFVPVRIEYRQPLIVASRNISKGERLTAEHLRVKYFNRITLRGNGFTRMPMLIGSRLKRNIGLNQPLLGSDLCVVCKGDKVTITAQNNIFQLKTTGVAQDDGNIGEHIIVQNSRSGRKITARVTRVAEVKVAL